ncbi:MAG: ATP-dependent zinc metalloprotease FtsH [Chloroflexi bacterium]|nr:ATP-dependent zinc metalloprotease FtsH [Chloroflexota bacterium]
MGRSLWAKKPLIYFGLFVVLLIAAFTLSSGGGDSGTIPLVGGTESLLGRLRTQTSQIDRVEIDGSTVRIAYNDGRAFQARIPQGLDFFEFLDREGVDVSQEGFPPTAATGGGGAGLGILLSFLPLILFGGLIIFMLRRARGAGSEVMSFGKSKARMVTANRPNTAFNDVAGADEAKEELQEVVEFLKFPERFAALGAKIPSGVLLVGPPGTGKTLIARAVAGEAAVPFFSVSGSEFVEMFVGVGASRVRDLFEQAKRNAPCIVFIDEIDAVGRQRGSGLGGNDEREQTLNQILVEMDGFDSATNVIVIAATNRPDILDPALMRPGRFDRQVVLDAPDVRGREAILHVHKAGKPLAADVDLGTVAKQTPGFSGADLANLLNEAAILAARRNKKQIDNAELEEAVDRVMVGPERKSRVLTGREQEIVAYHEAGHALVAAMTPGHDPVHKITIIPRGLAGGYTKYLPDEEQRLASRSHWEGFMASALGGHAAEELVFGEMTTGAHDDLSKATQIARSMITQWGMSATLGPRTYGTQESMVFLGRGISEQRDYSEKVAEQIDVEIHELIDRARDRARHILTANRARLNYLARRLREEETLEPDQLREIFAWEPGSPEPGATAPTLPRRSEPPPSTPPPSGEGGDDRGREPVMPPKPGVVWGGDRNLEGRK